MHIYNSLSDVAESDGFWSLFRENEHVSVRRVKENGVESAFVFIEKELSFDSEYINEVLQTVGRELKRLLKSVGATKKGLILAVGVGNEGMTADSLGARTLKYLDITEHLNAAGVKARNRGRLAAIAPGVGGVTGIDSFDVVKGVSERLKPAAVIAVDTLSAKVAERLKKVVQLSTDGLVPGSGVGNAKRALSEETLGVPVIAVGVPLVIEAVDIRLEGEEEPLSDKVRKRLDGLVVTVKEIDLAVEDFAKVIGGAINFAVHGT